MIWFEQNSFSTDFHFDISSHGNINFSQAPQVWQAPQVSEAPQVSQAPQVSEAPMLKCIKHLK